MTDLEKEALEAEESYWRNPPEREPFPGETSLSNFISGYIAGATARDKVIEELRAKLAETEQRLDDSNRKFARVEVKLATTPWIAVAFCAHAASRNGYPLEAEQVSEWLKTTATI